MLKCRITFIKASVVPPILCVYSECVFHGSLRSDAADILKRCLEIFKYFVFFSFAAREYPKLQARNHSVLRPKLYPDACYLLLRNVQIFEEEGWNFLITVEIQK